MAGITMPKQETFIPQRKERVHKSGARYVLMSTPEGGWVPESIDMYRAAMDQDKAYDAQIAKEAANAKTAEEMKGSAENIGKYGRGIAMMNMAKENPDFDYLNASTEDINKVAGGQALNDVYGDKSNVAYAADQGVLDTKNPYSQEIFKATLDQSLPKKEGAPSGLGAMFDRKMKTQREIDAMPEGSEKEAEKRRFNVAAGGSIYSLSDEGIQRSAEKASATGSARKNATMPLENEQKARQDLTSMLQGAQSPAGQQERKVNQAVHARTLIDSSRQPDGSYKMNKATHGELISTLAALLGGGAQATDSQRDELIQRSLSGDALEAYQYIRSRPEETIPQGIVMMLAHMIDRQGVVSEELRDEYINKAKQKWIPALNSEGAKRISDIKLGTSFKKYLIEAGNEIPENKIVPKAIIAPKSNGKYPPEIMAKAQRAMNDPNAPQAAKDAAQKILGGK